MSAAGVLLRRGGRAAVAVPVGVAVGVLNQQSRAARRGALRLLDCTKRSTAAAIGETTARSRREESVDVSAELLLLVQTRSSRGRWFALPLGQGKPASAGAQNDAFWVAAASPDGLCAQVPGDFTGAPDLPLTAGA